MMDSLKRLRVEYGKDDRLAYLGHLEVIGTIQRCVRRTALPFSIGNGFARRMRIQFCQALPVGASSSCEYFDVYLESTLDPAEALAELAAATPPALAPVRASYVDPHQDALEAWLTRATWECELVGEGLAAGEFQEGAQRLRELGSLTYMRGQKQKTVDLASTLVQWHFSPSAEGLHLELQTRSTPEGSLRPGALVGAICELDGVNAMGLDTLRVRRVAQLHEQADGSLVKPFEEPCTK